MSNTRRSSTSLAAALLAFALAAPSAGASGRDLWIECRDTGTVGANHSPQDYADAIASAPGDGAEYTPCLVAIKSAQQQAALRAAGGTPKAGSGGKKRGDGSSDEAPSPTGSGADRAAAPAVAPAGVTPKALGAALAAENVDPSAYPAIDGAAPPAAAGTGTPQQLGTIPESTVGRSLSLPLPIAALSLVGLLWMVQVASRIAARARG